MTLGETMPLPTAAPESHGLPSREIARLLDELEGRGLDPHALVIARHGEVLFRGAWSPWRDDQPALVYSVSKTFTAIAIGLLETEGLVDIGAPVDRYLDVANPHAITVRHLLTMNTGHDREQTLTLPFDVAEMLATPPAQEPGSSFAYNSPATFALSAIVTAVTGQSLTGYLADRLLRPIGIGERWWQRLGDLEQGFSGFHLTVDDLARIGIALAADGCFEGAQVVPASFLADAVKPWSSTTEGHEGDWALGYGYQLWRSRHGFRLDGAYGQFVLVMPKSGVVIAYQGATVRTGDTLEVLWQLMESFSDAPVDRAEADAAALAERTGCLDSWESRDRLTAAEALDGAEGWTLEDHPSGWLLTTPHGAMTVTADAWSHTELSIATGMAAGTAASADSEAGADSGATRLAMAVRGERRDDGSVLVHVIVPTSPHRIIFVRDAGGLRVHWHTAPLWKPVLDTLAVPASVTVRS